MALMKPTHFKVLRPSLSSWTKNYFARSFVTVIPSPSTPPVDIPDLQNELETLIRIKNCGPLLLSLPWHHQGHFGSSSHMCLPEGLLKELRSGWPQVTDPDFVCFASTVAIEVLGGPSIPFKFGRTKLVDLGVHSDGNKGASHVREMFGKFGITDREMVALMGAHSVGRCHTERSGFEGHWTTNTLQFNNGYFIHLLENDWKPVESSTGKVQYTDGEGHIMLKSDLSLVQDPKFRTYVEEFASSQSLFFQCFASAFTKLINVNLPQNLQE